MSRLVRTISLMLLSALLLSGQASAAARAFLDRTSITLGETVTLNIQLDRMSGAPPDLSALASSFRMLGTSNSSQVQIVNGQQTVTQLWAVALEPISVGVIGIPALQIGDETTEPLTLTVLPAAQSQAGRAGDDVFLEVDASPLDPYVQQQVRYVVRLYYAVNLAEGQLEEPQVEGARLQRMGGDTRYQKVIEDRRYEVIERRYALIPERSGTLEISAPRFRGAAIDGSRGGFFNGGRRLQADGDAQTLTVRPQPAGVAEPWLPAQAVSLTDESGALDGELRVGEPITLSIRLTASGLAADQLPELSLPAIDGAQIYPDLESSQTGDSGEWLTGERVRRFAVVPSKVGELTIPAMTVSWWNTATDKAEQTRIPARTLTILPSLASTAGVQLSPGAALTSDPLAPSSAVKTWQVAGYWPWLSLLLGSAWLVTLALLVSKTRRVEQVEGPTLRQSVDQQRARAALRRALDVGDLAEIGRQLRVLMPNSDGRVGLDVVATQLEDAKQADAVRALDQALYAGRLADGREGLLAQLRAAFRTPLSCRMPESVARGADGGLPPLYSSESKRTL